MISYSYRKTSVLTILAIISCSGQQENEIQGSDFPHLRMKRDVRQCKDKFKVLKTHSACQPRSSQVVEAGVNTSDIALILLEHNRYRGMVSPRATNMLKMIRNPRNQHGSYIYHKVKETVAGHLCEERKKMKAFKMHRFMTK